MRRESAEILTSRRPLGFLGFWGVHRSNSLGLGVVDQRTAFGMRTANFISQSKKPVSKLPVWLLPITPVQLGNMALSCTALLCDPALCFPFIKDALNYECPVHDSIITIVIIQVNTIVIEHSITIAI